jgi:competence protein ComEC
MQISEFNIANDKLSKLNGKGQVVLTGVISGEPDVRETSQKLDVRVSNSTILVTVDRYLEYNYLDKIKITGKLEAPMVTPDFNYKDYLLKDHIYSVMNFGKVELVSQKHQYNAASYLYEKILFVKQKLEQAVQNNFLPPHSLLLEGIIFGNNKNMTADLRDKLNAAGLRFLTAISGVHVIILSALLISLLMYFPFKKSHAFYLSIILIWLYVILTGFTASGIRAAIMGSIFIFATVFGRQNTSSRTIVLAGALMLMQNPLLLIYDVGFQLSFMASFGIIYLKPIINNLLKKLFREKFREPADLLSVTFAAQIFTLPIMIFNFGTMSLMAPITSILILPIMPLILAFGFLFSISAAISSVLGWIFYVPCWLLITYFLKIVEIFSQPWMVKTITNISWIWILAAYAILGAATWLLNKKFFQNFV